MSNAKQCPECDSYNTEMVNREVFTDTVEHARICNDCPVEYTVEYGNPIVSVV